MSTSIPKGCYPAPTLSEHMTQVMEQTLIDQLRKGEWLKFEHTNRIPVSKDTLQKCYAAVDMSRVIARVVDGLEQKLADSIITNMATEIGTDTKRIMCNTELREDLRAYLRSKMRASIESLT